MPFSSLGLSPALVRAANALGYAEPTPIQVQAIPTILKGGDVLGLAQTGSGKTAAFCLPLLQALQDSTRPHIRSSIKMLILVPTRELAAQVGEAIHGISQHLPVAVKTTVVFGGVSINPQMMGLRGGADIVVATPGRLLDLIDQNALTLVNVTTLVLDEADRLLDLGFSEELARILTLLPPQRQSLFFSATFEPSVQALADTLLRNPTRIEVASTPQTVPKIAQRAIEVDPSRRTQLLRHLIQHHQWPRVLVFVATKHAAEIVADKLRKADIWAEPFHGTLSQGKRTQVLHDFKNSGLNDGNGVKGVRGVQVVVATDLAARGIDIAELPVVVNYDLPRASTDYVHRIGRTARAGESGIAVSFISRDTAAHFVLIEKRFELNLTREQIAGFEPVAVDAPDAPQVTGIDAPRNAASAPGTGGIKGKRPSKKDKLRAGR
jgi:ATP-dependent RNA helicase RhlE